MHTWKMGEHKYILNFLKINRKEKKIKVKIPPISYDKNILFIKYLYIYYFSAGRM